MYYSLIVIKCMLFYEGGGYQQVIKKREHSIPFLRRNEAFSYINIIGVHDRKGKKTFCDLLQNYN